MELQCRYLIYSQESYNFRTFWQRKEKRERGLQVLQKEGVFKGRERVPKPGRGLGGVPSWKTVGCFLALFLLCVSSIKQETTSVDPLHRDVVSHFLLEKAISCKSAVQRMSVCMLLPVCMWCVSVCVQVWAPGRVFTHGHTGTDLTVYIELESHSCGFFSVWQESVSIAMWTMWTWVFERLFNGALASRVKSLIANMSGFFGIHLGEAHRRLGSCLCPTCNWKRVLPPSVSKAQPLLSLLPLPASELLGFEQKDWLLLSKIR